MGSDKPRKRVDDPSRPKKKKKTSSTSDPDSPMDTSSVGSPAPTSTSANDNPYLAHLEPKVKPSKGLIPGKTTAEQAEELENGTVNPFSGKEFTNKYREILKKRRDLPVHKQRNEFLEMLHNNQIIVLVGETGSGKTTQ